MRPLAILLTLLPGFAAAQDATAPAAPDATAEAAAPAAPAGDPAKGEADFARQCVACHVVQDPSGQVLAGRSGHTGPNLYGVVGRVAGSYPDYAYGESMKAYGATGAVWGEDNVVPYLQDPTAFLREALQDPSARGKMSYKVRKDEDAHDLFAFLATFPTTPAAPAP